MTELEVYEKLRANPLVYIGQRSLTRLVHFVGGYLEGMQECGVSVPEDTGRAMQSFVREWYGIRGEFHWSSILLMVGQTEEGAYNKFFELLDKQLQGYDPKTRQLPDEEETVP